MAFKGEGGKRTLGVTKPRYDLNQQDNFFVYHVIIENPKKMICNFVELCNLSNFVGHYDLLIFVNFNLSFDPNIVG